ncbi:MAG: hypothetical protein Q8O14_03000 [bacterium]|nr:hypothetical protein [bacterium]
MASEKSKQLSSNIREIGERLIECCHDGERFTAELKKLKPREVLEAQVFLWDFLHRLSKERGITFQRDEVTARMLPTSTYQYNVGCNERLDYCRANICVYTNPVCASNKLRGQLEAIRHLLSKLLG